MIKKYLFDPIKILAGDGKLTGLLLILATVISIMLSNSGLGERYTSIWHFEFGPALFCEPLLYWINDALMAVFFFFVGLEIKRELMIGQLSGRKQAMLPVFAAVGGMAAPALIFTAVNAQTSYLEGWAIPTATDIAFSLGILSLLGKKMPMTLKIFLTALAIIDDLGAVVIIAFFYSNDLHLNYLLLALGCLFGLLLLNKLKIHRFIYYFPIGLLLWFFVFESGVHATIGGVLFAFTIPLPMIEKLEHHLHRTVNYFIMPLFALANTAIVIPNASVLISPLSIGISLGLLIGKPVGILSLSYLAVKGKLAQLPSLVNWKLLLGAGCTAGIGFTMSIFIAGLSFKEVLLLDESKLAVLCGSLLSGIAGWLIISSKKNSVT